jgi:hypothetical protein
LRIGGGIIFFLLLLGSGHHTYGQHAYDQKAPVRNSVSLKRIEFIVRNGDNLKTIAAKTKIPIKEILAINKIRSKKYLAYPGRKLVLPVQIQSKNWDPLKEDMTGNSPSREDRGGSDDDYELVIDSSNYSILEDFIDLSAARSDSVEYENIGKHTQRIDKHIKYLMHKIDSIKQADFKFDYEDQDKNSVLGKMKQARDQYYAEGPIGKQIDSLKAEKIWLGQRLIVLNNQITEYENLIDNASYSEAHYKHDERDKTSTWGAHLAYESIYIKNRNEAAQALAKANGNKQDTSRNVPAVQPYDKPADATTHQGAVPISAMQPVPSPVAASVKTEAPPQATTAPAVHQDTTSPPVSATPVAPVPTPIATDGTPQAAPATIGHQDIASPPAPATTGVEPHTAGQAPVISEIDHAKTLIDSAPVSADKPVAVKNDAPPIAAKTTPANPSIKILEKENTPADNDAEPAMTHYKSDFAALPKQKNLSSIRSGPARPLVIITFDAAQLTMPAAKTYGGQSPPGIPSATGVNTTKPSDRTTNTANGIQPSPVTVNTGAAPIDTFSKKQINKAASPQKISGEDQDTTTMIKNGKSNKKSTLSKEKVDGTAISAAPQTGTVAAPAYQQDAIPPAKHDVVTIDAAPTTAATAIPASDQPAMTLDDKIDTTIHRPKAEVNTDPLASYKSDSDFVTKGIQIKEIPVTDYKNKPKYLIPTDSVEKIKGDFYLIRARQVLEKGDFKTGDKYLRKSLDLDPNNAQAWMLHADLFLTLGLADQALKEYEISGEIDSTNPKVFYNIALLYVKANNNQKAYKYFSKAIDVNEKYLLAYMGRASLLMDERDYGGAIQDYDKLLAINKYYSPAFKARGLAEMEVRKFAAAILDFNQYLEIEDPDGYVIYQRGISKIYANSLLQGCLDLSSAQELGFKEAEKAIKKFCE